METVESVCVKHGLWEGQPLRMITLNWFGPYCLERLHLYDIAYDNGIYAIYRKYHGVEKLLYIGKTSRNFISRIQEHDYWVSTLRGDVRIRLGMFADGRQYNDKTLADVEALLITWHQPAENTLNSRYYYGKEITVVNTGRRGSHRDKVTTANLEFA